jgi:hypothetical protein
MLMIEGEDYRGFYAALANARVAWAYFCRGISNFAGAWANCSARANAALSATP